MIEYERLDFDKIKTYPIQNRNNKVNLNWFSKPIPEDFNINNASHFFDLFPDILKSADLRELVLLIKHAFRKKKAVLLGMGAHLIKCGLSPLIIDLMKRGLINGLAVNGAFTIHDFEVAYQGGTSEDVSSGLADGTFGMVRETGDFINNAIKDNPQLGFGRCIGEKIVKANLPHKNLSVMATGYNLNIPITVHVAIGTDIVHQHSCADGKSIGIASYEDFKTFASMVVKINDGGGYINFGSNVIMPEVFLKALTVARNLSPPVKNFFTANFDMISHYRPNVNVVKRPVETGGKGFNFIGHHEIMFPLLYFLLLKELQDN